MKRFFINNKRDISVQRFLSWTQPAYASNGRPPNWVRPAFTWACPVDSAQTHLLTLQTQEVYFKEEIAAPRSQREDVYDNDGSVTHPSKTNKGEVLGRHGRSWVKQFVQTLTIVPTSVLTPHPTNMQHSRQLKN